MCVVLVVGVRGSKSRSDGFGVWVDWCDDKEVFMVTTTVSIEVDSDASMTIDRWLADRKVSLNVEISAVLSLIVLLCCSCGSDVDRASQNTENIPLAAQQPGDEFGGELSIPVGPDDPSVGYCVPIGDSFACSNDEDGSACCGMIGTVYHWYSELGCRIKTGSQSRPYIYECLNTGVKYDENALFCVSGCAMTCYVRDMLDGAQEVVYSTSYHYGHYTESAGWRMVTSGFCVEMEEMPDCE